MKLNFIIITQIFLFAQVHAQTTTPYSKLDSFINTLERNNKVMGVVSYSKNDAIQYTRSIGNSVLAEHKEPIKNSKSTLFRIGAVSKMFTAVMVLQLAEEGKISLKDPIDKYLTGIKNGDHITIEMLLHQKSGLADLRSGLSKNGMLNQLKNKEELLLVSRNKEQEFEPGTKSSYNEFNYVLLGYIIEKVSHESYSNVLTERISKRIGLSYTTVDTLITAAAPQAWAYEFADEQWKPIENFRTSLIQGAAGIISTNEELTKFINGLLHYKLINKMSFKKMTEIEAGFGMGIIRAPIYDEVYYGDIGLLGGYYTVLLFKPEDSSVISFTINGLNINLNDLIIGFSSILYHKPYPLPNFDTIQDKKVLELLQGEYTCVTSQKEITMDIKNGKYGLTGRISGQSVFSLFPLTPGKFSCPPLGVTVEFPQKNVLTLMQNGGIYKFIKVIHD